MQLDLGLPRFSVQMVRRFPQEDNRRKQFELEDALKSYVNARLEPTGATATSPPPVPRYVMADNKRQFMLSEVSAQLTLNFSDLRGGWKRLAGALPAAVDVMRKVELILAHQTRFYSGVIVEAEFPGAGWNVVESLYRAAFQKEPQDKLSSLILQVGRQVDEFNSLVEVSEYQSITANMSGMSFQQIFIDPDFSEVTERGIKLKFDVNSKPAKETGAAPGFEALIDRIAHTVDQDLKYLIGCTIAGLNGPND